MKGCPDCAKRSLWAYRTYRIHRFIVGLPKGSNTGLPFAFSMRNIIRWFAFKFILGHLASYWYRSVLKEGQRIYEYSTNNPNPEVSQPRMQD